MSNKKVYRVHWGPHRFYLPIGAKTLIAFLLVIGVFAGGLYYYTSHTLSRQVEEEALSNLNSKLQGAWRLYYARMDQMKYGMLQAASEGHVVSAIIERDSGFLNKLLRGYAANRPYVDLWAVVDANGVVIGRRNGKTGDILEIGGVVSKALRTGEVIQSTEEVGSDVLGMEDPRLASRVEREGLMQIVVTPVVSEGSVKGAFVTGILINGYRWLPDAIYRYLSVESAVFGGIFQEGRIISATASPRSVFTPIVRLPDGVTKTILKNKPFKGRVMLEGLDVYVVSEPILNMAGEVVGGIAVGIRGSEVKALTWQLRKEILVYASLTSLISLILAGLAYRDTVRPMNALVSAMEGAAGGDLDVRVDLKTKDEFEKLGEGFNRMVENIQVREERIGRFNELSKLLITSLDPEALLKMAVVKMVELIDSHMAVVYLHREDEGVLDPVVSYGVGGGELRQLKVGEGMAGLCAVEKKTIVLKDIPEESLLIEAGFAKVRPKSVIWFAMCYREKLLGVFAIGSLKPYDEDEIRHLEYLVAQVTIAFANALMHREVERLSIIDPLTGLFNRRYFFSRLETEFFEAKRYNHNLSIVICDIDHFKEINDTMGHQQGDMVLKELGKLLREQARQSDLLARYGGEEFIGYLPHCGKIEAYQFAERIRRLVEGYDFTGMRGKRVTVSLGVAYYPHPEVETVDDLIALADSSLYSAKRGGRNRVEVV